MDQRPDFWDRYPNLAQWWGAIWPGLAVTVVAVLAVLRLTR